MEELCFVVDGTVITVVGSVLGILSSALAANFLPNPVDVTNKPLKILLTLINWAGLNIRVNTTKPKV